MKWGRKRKYRRRNPFSFKLKKQTVATVGAIWLVLFAVVITVSFFGEGALLTRLREELVYQVGWLMYLLPPFLVLLSLLFFKIKSDIGSPRVPLGYAIVLVGLAGLTQAGVAGEVLWNTLSDAISAELALILYLALMLVGAMILFNASLERMVNWCITLVGQLIDAVGRWSEALMAKRDKPLFGQEKLPIRIKGQEEERPLAKAPVVPPPVPGRGKPAQALSGLIGPLTTKPGTAGVWEYPPLSLLSEGSGQKADRGDMKRNADIIEKTLDSFGIDAHVAEVNTGPAVTQYALKIALGTKVSKITSLSSDLALALAAPTGQVRIEAPIPGRDLVGIEIPNRGLEFVTLKKMLESQILRKAKSKLSVALGLDVSGSAVIADIAKMPHVLVAGTTGSGKSVLINSWICSLLFRTSPSEVRLIMVDPKRVELTGYNGIPHLLTPVIVEQDKILSALRWAMIEMEHRYKQFAEVGVRNIDGFNELAGFQAMPFIVILIDELADLMAYAPVEVEDTICRLAQMARATGIHLVLATQRPSVDVITGLIKANVPARIAFNVSSMVDSRVIIDMPGAEKLLGRGDMLYVPPDQAKPTRIQGTFVSEQEVNKVVEFFRKKEVPVEYTEEVTTQPLTGMKKGGITGGGDGHDPLFEDALRLICQYDKASASLLQRRLS
ncbi:MAG: DNA translocase FtsK, partial [Patescibacteria group bacterium]